MTTPATQRGDDGDTRIGAGDTSYDDLDAMLDAWRDRAAQLAEEAASMGFTTIVLISGHDPLDNLTQRVTIKRGNYYCAIGMLDDAKHEWQHGTT